MTNTDTTSPTPPLAAIGYLHEHPEFEHLFDEAFGPGAFVRHAALCIECHCRHIRAAGTTARVIAELRDRIEEAERIASERASPVIALILVAL